MAAKAIKFHYHSSAGKDVTRDDALGMLNAGSTITVSVTMKDLKISKVDGEYVAGCDKCNAKCKMQTVTRAVQWTEDHLRQYHT